MKQQNPADWARQMLELMSPPMRQRLLGQMLRNLRARNVKRIRAQQGPDGTAW